MDIPPKLYKYRSLAGSGASQVGQSVFEHKHFFNSPDSFNDPFECLPSFVFEGDPASRWVYLKCWYIQNAALRDDADQIQAAISFAGGDVPDLESMIGAYQEQSLPKLPMICLSAVPDNILMWSHYSSNHTGVCLEFDGSSPVFESIQRVRYSNERVVVDIVVKPTVRLMAESALTKSIDWDYEQEWRVLEPGKTRGLRVWPAEALTAIIVGDRISTSDLARVKGWVARRSPTIALRKATISRSDYKVDITTL